jgi:hypothetical protein
VGALEQLVVVVELELGLEVVDPGDPLLEALDLLGLPDPESAV